MTGRLVGRKHYCCVALTALVAVTAAWAVSPDIVISQVYGGGGNTGALYDHDFIELFNRGSSTVSITGWTVQYASATGSTWQTTALTGSLAPGQYFLIQEAAGAGNGAALPTPDVVASPAIAMSATAGKVALVNNSTALTGTCPTAGVVDFLGYGPTANCSETSPTAALTNSTADIRLNGGCTDTDRNAQDFAIGAPTPRNTSSTFNSCSGLLQGACCRGVGGDPNNISCTIETQASCTGTGGGVYQGNNTTCVSNPCGAPTGACCNATACSVDTRQNCVNAGGTYLGNGTSCLPTSPCIPDMTIYQAKTGGPNRHVRLANVTVSSATDLVSDPNTASFQLQDATGGITVYGDTTTIANLLTSSGGEGWQITLEGVTNSFNGLMELVAPFNFVSKGSFAGVPAAKPVRGPDFFDGSVTAEGFESEIVQVFCVTFSAPGNFAGNTNYVVVDPNGTFTVRITTGLDIVGTPIPDSNTQVNIVGIFYQNGSTATSGYQLLPRSLADITPGSGCTPTGACCLGGGSCAVMTQAACTGAGGIYRGNGSACLPNPCKGACCVAGLCSIQTPADCTGLTGVYLGDSTECAVPLTCPVAVQAGDIAFGLSDPNQYYTAEQIRAGAKIGAWAQVGYLQSMEFDNANGGTHNAAGNLLALDYGGTQGTGLAPDCASTTLARQGGRLFSFATNGTPGYQKLFDMAEPNRTILSGECSRLGGLSVSPDNHYVAMWGYDTSKLYVLAYNAGGAPGTGSGASITNGWAFTPTNVSVQAGTNGTAWLDNDTILLYTSQLSTGLTDIATVDFSGGTFTETVRRSFNVGATGTSVFTDVEYNPAVSPYVFCSFSVFAGTTQNRLTVIDPSSWSQLKQIDLSDPNTLNTAREIALGPDNFLYISQYHSTAGAPFIDRIDATDPTTWTNNSTTDYYSGPTFASFNGLDVAFQPPAPTTGACCQPDGSCAVTTQANCSANWLGAGTNCSPNLCPQPQTGACCVNYVCSIKTAAQCTAASGKFKGVGTTCTAGICTCRGDVNCDGQINYADINPFVKALGSLSAWQAQYPTCPWQNCDINGDNLVNYADINPFVAKLGNTGPCP